MRLATFRNADRAYHAFILEQGIMKNALTGAASFALLCVLFTGCGGRSYTGERRFLLSGRVTVDGEPMQHGLISFLPKEEKAGRVTGGPITKGTYTIPEDSGATAGTYSVQINWNKPTGKKVKSWEGEEIMDEYKEGLPAKYHTNSELTVEVSAKQTVFDFDLKTK
jgi:hypothetical protein